MQKLHTPAVDWMAALRSLGTLGGGNHFIEIDRDDQGNLYLVIHTGSRLAGRQIATWYQKQAALQHPEHPGNLAPCTGELMEQYLHDMQIAQKYAGENRRAIADTILSRMNLHEVESFETVHNYIDLDAKVLRKGAVSALKDEILLIPINMRDGALICKGKGNPDWNCSAPHGSGRIFSRAEAKELISLDEYQETMKEAGVYTTSVKRNTIDESPFAYKSMQDILDHISPSADILKIIRPVYNFKAH